MLGKNHLIDLSLLRHNRNYRLLYLGQFISFMGGMITYVALPYQIYHQTHSTLLIGLLSLFQLLPVLITALFGGILADRHHRRKLLIIAEALLSIGSLALALNAMQAKPSILAVFIIAPAIAAILGLHRPSLVSITQQIVKKEDFAAASALKTFMYSISMITGPALGGLIIAHFGLVNAFIVDFMSFFVSFIAILLLRDIPKPTRLTDQSAFSSLKQAYNYAKSKHELLGTYFVDFTAMLFGTPTCLMPAIAQHFNGVKTLGMLYSAPAVGALIISFFSGWTRKVKRHGAMVAVAAILWGIAISLFGLSKNLWLALFFLMLSGLFDAISGIFRGIIWNEAVPNNFRGRMSGIEMLSYLSGPKLGDTEAGLVASAIGVTASIVTGGILCVFAVTACCLFLPKFWHYKPPKN